MHPAVISHKTLHPVIIHRSLLLIHIVDRLHILLDVSTFLQISKDVRLGRVKDIAELLNRVHSLWLPVVEVTIDEGKASQFVRGLIKLWIPSISMVINRDATLTIQQL